MSIAKNKNLASVICTILYVFLEEIASIDEGRDLYHKTVILKNGKAWKGIYFTPGSAELSEQEKDEDQGSSFERKLKFLFPGESESNSLLVSPLCNRPVILLIGYNDGKYKFLGDLDRPARILRNLSVSPKITGISMEALCQDAMPPRWYDTINHQIPYPDTEIGDENAN